MLQMVRNTILAAGALILLGGCNSLDFKGLLFPTGAGVEKRFDQSQEMTSGKPVATVPASEEYGFYVCTDPHIDDTQKNLRRFNDDLRKDANASFGIILGDCIDVRDNLPAYLDATAYSAEKHLYDYCIFHLLGNHDTYFNGWEDFKELIGPSVFWFEVDFSTGKDLYISLDSATGTLGGKQTRWVKNFLAEHRGNYRHCIILTHTNLLYTDNSQTASGNLTIEETLGLIDIFRKNNVTLVLQGHDHFREDVTQDNVRYIVIGAIKDGTETPEYLKVRATPEHLKYDWMIL